MTTTQRMIYRKLNDMQKKVYDVLEELIERISKNVSITNLLRAVVKHSYCDLNTIAFVYYGQNLDHLAEFVGNDDYTSNEEFHDEIRQYGARIYKEKYDYMRLGSMRAKDTGFGAVMKNTPDPHFIWLVDFEFAARIRFGSLWRNED